MSPADLRAIVERHKNDAANFDEWGRPGDVSSPGEMHADCGALLALLRRLAQREFTTSVATCGGSQEECLLCGATAPESYTPECTPDCPAPLLEALR